MFRSHLDARLAVFESEGKPLPNSAGLALIFPLRRSRMQLQVLAMLGSLSGIAYPTRVETLISVARLANFDLVRIAVLP